MKREIITTADGSATIHLPEMQESYHSKFGAIQEARHVFIKNGFELKEELPLLKILEIGFGTSLNALITYTCNLNTGQAIQYTGVEAYPVTLDEASRLNYPQQLGVPGAEAVFNTMHSSPWGTDIALSDTFTLHKKQQFFQDINDEDCYHLIYFDAFGYHAQPELWSTAIFKKMYAALTKNGVLVTYACRTAIKNAMAEAGFTTEKLPGPPGKREMLRAFKF